MDLNTKVEVGMGLISKALRKATKVAISAMPDPIKHRVYRRMLRIPIDTDKKFQFKVANKQDELAQAFGVLHTQYVESGYMQANSSGKRFTFYHALPSTTVVIAKKGNQVVGTCSLIQSNTYGLPAEKIVDLSELKKGNKSIIEISSLAVDSKVDRRRGEINIPLTVWAVAYGIEVLKADYMVLTCNPKWKDFYIALYGFRPLENLKSEVSYSFVNGAPAVGLYLPVADLQKSLYKLYDGVTDNSKNFYTYYRKAASEQVGDQVFENYYTYHKPSMKIEALKEFYEEHPEFFQSLSSFEKQILYSYFQDFQDIAKIVDTKDLSKKRRAQRFPVRCEAIRVNENGEPYGQPFFFRNASILGFCCDAHGVAADGMKIHLTVRVGPFFVANVTARIVRATEDMNSCEIVAADEHWHKFIEAQYATISDLKDTSLDKISKLSKMSLSRVG